MVLSEALVTPRLVAWARERAGLTPDVLAKRVGTKAAKVVAWEAGSVRPTFKQAQKLAAATHVPFGFLFLPKPPVTELGIPDLRTVPGELPFAEDPNFVDELQSFQFKMDWYRAFRSKKGLPPLAFVGRFKERREATRIAKDMRETLGLTADVQSKAKTADAFLSVLVDRAEQVGIWVARSGVVGNNTSRPLNVDVARGFAITDPLVPLVFVNAQDARAAQIFTLAHELAHLWVGESGISDPFADASAEKRVASVEAVCNSVAAEFLVPEDRFRASWRDDESLGDNATRLATEFKVSRIVVALRARELALIDLDTFTEFLAQERRQWKRQKEDTSGGGDYYRSAKTRNGPSFFFDVISAAQSGDLLLREAGRLLDIKPRVVRKRCTKRWLRLPTSGRLMAG
jgi:Zn-dependent peptidase ImmA (M78 family)/transcriptional regulator with XRE-family HTH domain